MGRKKTLGCSLGCSLCFCLMGAGVACRGAAAGCRGALAWCCTMGSSSTTGLTSTGTGDGSTSVSFQCTFFTGGRWWICAWQYGNVGLVLATLRKHRRPYVTAHPAHCSNVVVALATRGGGGGGGGCTRQKDWDWLRSYATMFLHRLYRSSDTHRCTSRWTAWSPAPQRALSTMPRPDTCLRSHSAQWVWVGEYGCCIHMRIQAAIVEARRGSSLVGIGEIHRCRGW